MKIMSFNLAKMNRSKIRYVCLLLLTIKINSVSGQTNFREGFIINNQHDTIKGLIDYRGDIKNSTTCIFKKDENSTPIKYLPGEIKGYRFMDGKFYISRLVKVGDEEKNLFLEYLVNGIVDLYYYRDFENDYYFVEKECEDMIELTNEKKELIRDARNEYYSKSIVYSNLYIGILKALFADCEEVAKKADNTKFEHNSLIKITKSYHDYVCDW